MPAAPFLLFWAAAGYLKKVFDAVVVRARSLGWCAA